MGIAFGFYWDNGKENGNHYVGFRVHLHRSSVFLVVEPSKIIFLIQKKNNTPKGGYNFTLYWVP